MRLKYDYWEGTFRVINNSLKKSISQYTRHHGTVKIGITCNPERRVKEHLKMDLGWEIMVVKYKTSSIKFINKMEKSHIEYQWEFITNQVNGGGGPNGKNGPYYLYLLLKK